MPAAKQAKFSVPTTKIILSGPHSVHWIPADTVITQDFLKSKVHASEMAHAKTIKAKPRREEFLRGRWLYHKVTRVAEPLLKASSGEPKWPENILASISHKEGHVMFCQVPFTTYHTIGMDLEKVEKVKTGFEEKICSKEESELLDRILRDPFQKRGDLLALIFSYKEALFKAHFFLGKKHFGFHDACVYEIDLEKREIKTRLNVKTSDLTPKDHLMLGFYNWISVKGEKFVVTTAEERRPEAFIKPFADVEDDEEKEKEEEEKAAKAKKAAEEAEDDDDEDDDTPAPIPKKPGPGKAEPDEEDNEDDK